MCFNLDLFTVLEDGWDWYLQITRDPYSFPRAWKEFRTNRKRPVMTSSGRLLIINYSTTERTSETENQCDLFIDLRRWFQFRSIKHIRVRGVRETTVLTDNPIYFYFLPDNATDDHEGTHKTRLRRRKEGGNQINWRMGCVSVATQMF